MWHDLSEDDLILPAHGSEYVLKGSELFEDSNSGKLDTCFISRCRCMYTPCCLYIYLLYSLDICLTKEQFVKNI